MHSSDAGELLCDKYSVYFLMPWTKPFRTQNPPHRKVGNPSIWREPGAMRQLVDIHGGEQKSGADRHSSATRYMMAGKLLDRAKNPRNRDIVAVKSAPGCVGRRIK